LPPETGVDSGMSLVLEKPRIERRRLFGRDFSLWYLSRSISVAGTAASAVALPLLVYRTSQSASLTAAVVGLEAVPYLLFGLFAGAAADRLNRKAMMVAADLGCALMLATVPIAKAFGVLTSWHVLLAAFAIGSGFCWFDAAAWGAFVRLVGKARVTQANSLIWSTEIILEIVAPAAAGLLSAVADPTAVLAANAATYLVSAALLSRITTPLNTGTIVARPLRTEIGEGLRCLWGMPAARTLTMAGLGLNIAVGGVLGLLVVHATTVLGLSAADRRIGLLYTAGAIGSLIAAVVMPPAIRRAGQGVVSIAALAMFVIAIIGLAATSDFGMAMGLWALWAIARLTVNANGITVRQLLTPDHLQGRVNTTGRMISWGGTPFGALIGGVIADSYGVRVAYLVLAIPAVLGLALVMSRDVRSLHIIPE
jgi:MFS family permease